MVRPAEVPTPEVFHLQQTGDRRPLIYRSYHPSASPSTLTTNILFSAPPPSFLPSILGAEYPIHLQSVSHLTSPLHPLARQSFVSLLGPHAVPTPRGIRLPPFSTLSITNRHLNLSHRTNTYFSHHQHGRRRFSLPSRLGALPALCRNDRYVPAFYLSCAAGFSAGREQYAPMQGRCLSCFCRIHLITFQHITNISQSVAIRSFEPCSTSPASMLGTSTAPTAPSPPSSLSTLSRSSSEQLGRFCGSASLLSI